MKKELRTASLKQNLLVLIKKSALYLDVLVIRNYLKNSK